MTPSMPLSSDRRFVLTFQDRGQTLGRHEAVLTAGRAVIVGRSAPAAEIVVPSDLVSRKHLSLRLADDGGVDAMDLGSGNGTFIQNRELKPHLDHRFYGPFTLDLGAEISMSVEPLDASAAPAASRTADTVRHGEAPIHTAAHSEQLSQLLLRKSRVLIGRGRDCDIRLDDDLVSRNHAAVTREKGRTLIEDLGSGNGTYVDGRMIRSKTEIRASSHIFIGRHVLGLAAAAVNLAKETAVLTHGLGLIFPGGTRGLHKTDIQIETGSMTAILGPSGCGKSTLLRALAGDLVPSEGRVEVFGIDLVDGYDYLRNIIGYVPQDDIVHRELTVDQAVRFAARLRLENHNEKQIHQKVEQVLGDLRISHIRNHLISRISGGQRKRVSIAVELLSTPMILFLDEPTSPLDPQSVEEFLSILRGLAEKGTTVVMVTHKPEDLAFMEKAIFMAEGGHVVYSGSTVDYLEYFGVRRTSEVYAHLAGGSKEAWLRRYASQGRGGTAVKAAGVKLKPARADPFKQWWWLTQRNFAIKTNDHLNSALLVAQAPVIAALICLIFSEIGSAVPFLAVISAIWLGTNNSVREIVSERAIFKRERMFNLQLVPYIASKFCVLGTFAAVQAVTFVGVMVIGFALRGSDPGWNQALPSTIWMAAVCLSATSMGLLLSASMDKTEKVMTVVPVVLIPQIMLAGSIARIGNWPVELLSYATLSRWANEGLTILQKDIHLGIPVQGPAGEIINTADAHAVLRENLGDRYESLFGPAAGTLGLAGLALVALSAIFIALTFKQISKIH